MKAIDALSPAATLTDDPRPGENPQVERQHAASNAQRLIQVSGRGLADP